MVSSVVPEGDACGVGDGRGAGSVTDNGAMREAGVFCFRSFIYFKEKMWNG